MPRPRPPLERRLRVALLALNGVGAATSAAFAVRGALHPTYVQPTQPDGPLSSFWSASSAVRGLSITVPLLGALALPDRDARSLLVVAGLVQLGDSGLGVWQRKPDMTFAPAVMGFVHLASARLLSR